MAEGVLESKSNDFFVVRNLSEYIKQHKKEQTATILDQELDPYTNLLLHMRLWQIVYFIIKMDKPQNYWKTGISDGSLIFVRIQYK